MKLVQFPYRWMWRTAWGNISHIFWDFKNGLRSLYVFFEAVWWHRPWDSSGMLHLMEVSARELRSGMDQHIHVNDERYSRQLLIVESICRRLREDEYFTNAGHNETWRSLSDHRRQHIAQHSVYMAKQDAAYLGRLFKFVQSWWS